MGAYIMPEKPLGFRTFVFNENALGFTQLPLYKPPFLVHKESSTHFAPAIWGWEEAADSLQQDMFSPGLWVPFSSVCGQRLCMSIFSTSSFSTTHRKTVPHLGISQYLRLCGAKT